MAALTDNKPTPVEVSAELSIDPAPAVPAPPIRLKFLDGMRGMAAFYVVLFHAAGDSPPSAPWLQPIAWVLQFGHYAVDIFMVLSGYCLMLPVVRSGSDRVRGGFRGYLRRRARRILPAYYAVLALAIFGVAFVQSRHPALNGEELQTLDLSPGTVLSHLFLVHNVRFAWSRALDPPMWSVALEWQIYLLFPLVLLPAWRRFGAAATVACAFAIGLAPHFVLPASGNLDWTFPWYLGLFTFGMAAAAISFSTRRKAVWWRTNAPWGRLAIATSLLFAVMAGLHADWPESKMWLPDIVLGLAIAAFIVRAAQASRSNPLVSLLQQRPFVWLGTISYSLYLIHAPALYTLYPVIQELHLSDGTAFLFRILIGTPLSLLAAALLYRLVERTVGRANVPY